MNKGHVSLIAFVAVAFAAVAMAQRGPATGGLVMPPIVSSMAMVAIPPGLGAITGRIVEAGGESPVPNVPVMIRAIPQPGATQTGIAGTIVNSDERGEFAVRGIMFGRYTVSAEVLGHTRARQLSSSLVPNIIVTLSGTAPDGVITIPMARTGGISGKVTDKSGAPMAMVTVRLLRRVVVSPALFWQALPVTAFTDQAGEYRFTNAPAGEYVVGVYYHSVSFPTSVSDAYWKSNASESEMMRRLADSGASAPLAPVSSSGPTIDGSRWSVFNAAGPVLRVPSPLLPFRWTTYHPAAATIDQATSIHLEAGEERTGVNVSVRETTGVRVSGKLTGEPSQIAYVGLRLMPARETDLWPIYPNEIAATVTDAEGRFTFLGVPPGSAIVQSVVATLVAPPPQAPRRTTVAWVRKSLDVGARDIAGLELPLAAPLTVRGRLILEGTGTPPMSAFRLHAMPTMSQPPTGLPAAADQFGFGQVIGGSYLFDMSPNGRWMIRSVTVAGKEVLNKTFEVTSDVSDVVVTMTTAITRISGSVLNKDGSKSVGAQVIVIPADYRKWIADGRSPGAYRSGPSSATGTYSMSELPPGEYLVAAFATNIENDWQAVSALEALASNAQRIRLKAGETITADIRNVFPDIPKARKRP